MTRTTLFDNIESALETVLACKTLATPVDDAAAVISHCLKSGGKLLACGNGGSAADAMHFATEFVSKFNKDRRPYPAICLNVSGGDLSAIGNDYAYEQVFSRQVNAYGKPGDVIVAFTSSGRSRNILLALEASKSIGMKSVAFLGKGGGFTTGVADVEIMAPGTVTARVQEAQKLLLHTICEIVELELGH